MTDTGTTTSPDPKKRSIGKLIARLILVFVVLIVVGVLVLYLSKDALVRAGVIRGGKYATDQDTSLTQASLAVFDGDLTLDELGIKNLEGYKEKQLLVMKKCATRLDTGSLFSHTVVIKEIAIDGLELTLEQNGSKNNLNELIAVLQKKTPAAGQSSNTSPGKELKIEKLHLTGTKVHIRGLLTLDLDLGPIEMTDPTNPDGRPMKIADLVGRILLNVSKQLLEDPRLPSEIREEMKNVSAVVDKLRGPLNKDVKELSKSLKNIDKDPAKALQDLGKTEKDLKDLGKNLKDLNPFDSKPKTQPK